MILYAQHNHELEELTFWRKTMKLKALIKHLSASAIVLGLAVSCATPETVDGTDSIAKLGSSSAEKIAAESAIDKASSKLSAAKGDKAEWRDTGKMIKAAKKALAAGDYAKAKSLAEAATAQSEYAIFQANIEEGKFEAATDFDAAVAKSATSNSGWVTNHTVATGDSLWGISATSNVYDDPYKWPLIYKENASKITDPDLIFPGQELDINQNALSAETEAAISHARNRGAWSIGGAEQSDADYLSK